MTGRQNTSLDHPECSMITSYLSPEVTRPHPQASVGLIHPPPTAQSPMTQPGCTVASISVLFSGTASALPRRSSSFSAVHQCSRSKNPYRHTPPLAPSHPVPSDLLVTQEPTGPPPTAGPTHSQSRYVANTRPPTPSCRRQSSRHPPPRRHWSRLLHLAGSKSSTYSPAGTCARLSALRIAGYGTAVPPRVAPPIRTRGYSFVFLFRMFSSCYDGAGNGPRRPVSLAIQILASLLSPSLCSFFRRLGLLGRLTLWVLLSCIFCVATGYLLAPSLLPHLVEQEGRGCRPC